MKRLFASGEGPTRPSRGLARLRRAAGRDMALEWKCGLSQGIVLAAALALLAGCSATADLFSVVEQTVLESAQRNATPDPPATPENVEVLLPEANGFVIEWDFLENNHDGFRVYEGIPDGVPEAELAADARSVSSADVAYGGNPGDEVHYTVVAYNAGGESQPAEVTFATVGYFTTIWDTDAVIAGESSPAGSVSLGLAPGGTYDFTVDWGDGTTDEITSWNQAETTHAYSASGIYEIKIYGTIEGWSFYQRGYDSAAGVYKDRNKLREISSWGPFSFGANNQHFRGANNLVITATDLPDLSKTTSLFESFYYASSLQTVPRMGEWDTSTVTDMSGTFHNAGAFNTDIGGWDTSTVETMESMFRGARVFDQDIGAWDTDEVTDMSNMFRMATSFNRDIGGWDTGNVTTMQNMFAGSSGYAYRGNFNQDIGGWDISSVQNMSGMFSWNDSMSTGNWASIMIGWESGSPPSYVHIHEPMLSPVMAADSPGGLARQKLIDTHQWTFN